MRNEICRFMQESPAAKQQVFANNPFGIFVRSELPEALYSTGLVDRQKYLITASVGAGNWAIIPWVCIFDRSITTSATKGIYIVYLLSKDSKRLYLTFNQGCTDIRNQHTKRETIRILHQKADEIRSFVSNHGFVSSCDIDLGDDLTDLGDMYREGTIFYKRYDVDSLPEEEQLRDDLSHMLKIYAEFARGPQKDERFGSFDSWTILDEKTAIKTCDKSFFEYRASGVPRGIRWFFNVDDLGVNEVYHINLFYEGKRYPGQIRHNSADGTRGVNLSWNTDLGKLLEMYCNFGIAEATFIKVGSNSYELTMKVLTQEYEQDVNIGTFRSWTIVDRETAIKTCDTDFFNHFESGVPKPICWFFDAVNFENGQSRKLIFRYESEEYEGYVRADYSASKRVRIFWGGELGRRLLQFFSSNTKAIFHKCGKDLYEITMIKDKIEEEEVVDDIIDDVVIKLNDNEVELLEDKSDMNVKEQIEQIKAYISSKGCIYEKGFVENFYLSLKAKPFVILSGTSAIRGTRFVRFFAEAIGAEYEQVAVRPDWFSPKDLIGSVNANGKFIPGRILSFLWEARENPEIPFILCLDEMNSTRVEDYFSDFLSIMETREWVDERIKTDCLVSEYDYGLDGDAWDQYGIIRFPENLYIVGMVDVYGYTIPLYVTDRANTIELDCGCLDPAWNDSFRETKVVMQDNRFLRSQYLHLLDCPESQRDFISYICTELELINNTLGKANMKIGYSMRDEIVFYMLINQEMDLLDGNEAFDNAIMQRILPRFQGESTLVKNILCELFVLFAGDYESYRTKSNTISEQMEAFLKKNAMVRHPKSAKKIVSMVRRIEEE